jgi:hypothetical protein
VTSRADFTRDLTLRLGWRSTPGALARDPVRFQNVGTSRTFPVPGLEHLVDTAAMPATGSAGEERLDRDLVGAAEAAGAPPPARPAA